MVISSAHSDTVARQPVYDLPAQTRCSCSSSPGLPRGLFGAGFEAVWPRAARTFLRTFWQDHGNCAATFARGVPIHPLGPVFHPIGKQTCNRLENLGMTALNGRDTQTTCRFQTTRLISAWSARHVGWAGGFQSPPTCRIAERHEGRFPTRDRRRFNRVAPAGVQPSGVASAIRSRGTRSRRFDVVRYITF